MALTGLQKLANLLEAFDPEKEIQEIVRRHTRELEDLLKGQISQGEDSEGNLYTYKGRRKYSPFTVAKKSRQTGLAAVTSHFTLFNSGELYKRLTLIAREGYLKLADTAPYFQLVQEAVGGKVFELSEESRKRFYQSILLPEFKESFERKTGVKLTIK